MAGGCGFRRHKYFHVVCDNIEGGADMSYMQKSPWVIHFDGTGCRGCGSEVKSCLAPSHDFESAGIKVTDNPKHADVLLITGLVDNENSGLLERIYDNMVSPKRVVAAGACACSAGIFGECSSIVNGADNVVPVDVYVPGCASRPENIIDGIIQSFEKVLEERDGAAEDDVSGEKEESQEENEDE